VKFVTVLNFEVDCNLKLKYLQWLIVSVFYKVAGICYGHSFHLCLLNFTVVCHFRYNLESWREYSYLDEEEKEKGEK